MARNRLNAPIEFTADAKGVVREVKRAQNQLQRLSKQMQRTRRSQNRLNASMSKFGSIAGFGGVGGIVAGLGLGFGALAKQVFELDTALTKVQFLVGVTGDNMVKLKNGLAGISGETGRGLSELGDALFDITSAGFRGGQALDVLRGSAQAAVLGLGSTKQIADATTNALGAWGSQNLSVNKTLRTLWAGVREGKAPSQAFGKFISNNGSLAAQLGVQVDHLVGAFAHLTRSMTADTASVRVKGILKALVKPSEQARTELAKYGLTVRQVSGWVAKDLVGGLTKLREIMGDDSLAKMFRDVQGLAGVFGLTGQNYRGAAATVAGVVQTTQKQMDAAVQGAGQSFSNQMNMATAEMRANLNEFGEAIMPAAILAVKGFSNAIGNAADLLNALGGQGDAGKAAEDFAAQFSGIAPRTGAVSIQADTVGNFRMVDPGETMRFNRSDELDAQAQIMRRLRQSRFPIVHPQEAARQRSEASAVANAAQAQRAAQAWQKIAHDAGVVSASYVDILAGEGEARILQRQRVADEKALLAQKRQERQMALSSGTFEGATFLQNMQRSMSLYVQRNNMQMQGLQLTERQVFLRQNIGRIDEQIFDARQRIGRLQHDMKFQSGDDQIISQNEIDSLTNYIGKLEQGKGAVREFALQITNSVQGEIVPSWARLATEQQRFDSIMSASRGHMKGFFMDLVDGSISAGDAFKRMGARMLETIWEIQVAEQAAGQLSGLIGSLFAGFGGAAHAPINAQALRGVQYGGNVLANEPYIVGERGPQVFIPHTSGEVMANGSGGGQVTQVFNYNISSVDASGVRAALAEQVPKIAARARQEMTQQLTRPGPLRHAVTGR